MGLEGVSMEEEEVGKSEERRMVDMFSGRRERGFYIKLFNCGAEIEETYER